MPVMLNNKSEKLLKHPPGAGLEVQPEIGLVQRQRRQMLIALGIVMIAILLLLMKNWQSLFPTPTAMNEPERLEHSIWPTPAENATVPNAVRTSIAGSAKPKAKVTPPDAQTAPTPAAAITDRAVLPPLEVEVVAGRQRQTLQPRNNAVRLDMSDSESVPVPTAQATIARTVPTESDDGRVVNAGEVVKMSADVPQVVSRPVDPNYPLLAKQMKVQGSVVMQALIGKAGGIEDLHVLSGPAILSSAAMEAVKQWRFRPYYLSGQAVETQARITVNFTISTY